VENIIFCSPSKNDVDDADTRLLSYRSRISVKRCDLYRCARNKKVTGGLKIDTDDDNFTHMQNRPLKNGKNTEVCIGVRSPT